ncbi:MAG: cytochrome P450 [Pseudomonadota bacterium]
MSWSPFAAKVMADPAAGHHELLERCPVHRTDQFDPPFYTLSRYEDVEQALRDIDTFSSQYGQGPRFTNPQGMLCDPPQHTFMRKLVQRAFTPRSLAELSGAVEALTHELIDTILTGDGQVDLHDDFAFPLPVVIIAGMLGVPTADLEQFKHWSDIQVAAMGAEDPAQYAAEQQQFLAYMSDHLLSRRSAIEVGTPVPDDLLSLIAGARFEDGSFISVADALSVLMQLLVGGNETTTSLITNLLWRLLEAPERWLMLLSDRSLIDAAIEESLRYDPPVLGLYRSTTRAVTLHGVTMPEGSKVLINYAAANRDPRVFERPDVFDLQRARPRHMAFGLGVHFCLGAPMARMEAEIALRALLDRLPELRLLGTGTRIAPFFLWGRRQLPAAWR